MMLIFSNPILSLSKQSCRASSCFPQSQTRTERGVTHQIPVLKPFSSSADTKVQANTVDLGGVRDLVTSGGIDTSGEVNMEASIRPDDVIQAGGFGARDDISNFLPVTSDSTDFEATIRDARDYEEPQGDLCRPGLGWTKD